MFIFKPLLERFIFMSKKKKSIQISNHNNSLEAEPESFLPISNSASSSNPFEKYLKGFVPYLILLVSSFILYANTFNHEYALDDDIVICKNEYVLEGINGIPSIFSKDLFASFYNQMNTTAQLTGGRYRPLSVASFALEQEFIGKMELPDSILNNSNAESRRVATNNFLNKYLATEWDGNKNGVGDIGEDLNGDSLFNDKDSRVKGFGFRHINNVLFYGLSICILFLFLSSVVFKQNKILALIISLLFLAHPIHTEVVANVKSRDEIFSFLFMILTLVLVHKIKSKNKLKYILLSCFTFLLALLSKEYGATLLGLIPLSLYLFSEKKFELSNYLGLFGALLITFFIYVGMRSQAGPLFSKNELQDTEIMNSPYLLATATQEMATKIFMLLKYFGLLILPVNLCSDYGFNSIPYKNFADLNVIASILLIIGILVAGLVGFRKKSWISFAIAFYIFNLMLVSNFIFNVGATMGERMIFHSSLGFCMILGFGIQCLSKKINKQTLAILFVLPILAFYSLNTFSRNKAWKNDTSLHLTDVEINPNSVALNGNAASRNLDLSEKPENKGKEKEFIQKSIQYGTKAISIHPEFVNGHLNLGLAFAKMELYDSAKVHWDIAFKIYPHHPQKDIYYNLLAETYYNKGYNLGAKQQWAEGKIFLEKAVEANPNNAKYWYDLGGFSFNSKDYTKAKEAWTKAYQLNPSDTNIQKVQNVLK